MYIINRIFTFNMHNHNNEIINTYLIELFTPALTLSTQKPNKIRNLPRTAWPIRLCYIELSNKTQSQLYPPLIISQKLSKTNLSFVTSLIIDEWGRALMLLAVRLRFQRTVAYSADLMELG